MVSKLNYKCCLDSVCGEGMGDHFAGAQDLFMFLCRALAASAPIWQFGDLVPCGTFFSMVTNDFKKSGAGCSESIRNSWNAINHLSSTGKTSFSKNSSDQECVNDFDLCVSWVFWYSVPSTENCLVNLALLLSACFVVSQISFRPGGMQNPGPNVPKVR